MTRQGNPAAIPSSPSLLTEVTNHDVSQSLAKTVVASLWKVPDAATARLMQQFYENLWDKKLGKLASLREAQIWMLRDQGNRGLDKSNRGLIVVGDNPQPAKLDHLPPQYWTAFVLSGDWR